MDLEGAEMDLPCSEEQSRKGCWKEECQATSLGPLAGGSSRGEFMEKEAVSLSLWILVEHFSLHLPHTPLSRKVGW